MKIWGRLYCRAVRSAIQEQENEIEPTGVEAQPGDSDAAGNSQRSPRIGILVVAYNAESTLASVLDRVPESFRPRISEIFICDDASADSTYLVGLGYKQENADLPLNVIRHPENLGYGGNQKAGYRMAIDQGLDIIVMLHGDGQYAPECLPEIVAPLERGEADCVMGSRMMIPGDARKGGMPLYKYVGNRILTTFENGILGTDLTEFHSGYRAYRVDALATIPFERNSDDFHFDTQIIIQLVDAGKRIVEVPIPTFYGDEICYVNGMKYAKAIMRAVYRYKETSRAVRCYPEYQEYFVPYAIKRSLYSSHYYAARLVGTDQHVLEVGCGDGRFGSELVKAGNRVIGVDQHPHVALEAGYAKVVETNLESGLSDAAADRAQGFDRVLLLDVLEHLRDPNKLVEDAKALLAPRGRVIVSVPNVVNIVVRLMFLFGSFRYNDRGILDWSHLRFFTRKSISSLLEKHGYRISERRYTNVPIERLIPLAADNPLLRLLNGLLHILTSIAPGLFAYEILLTAEKR